MVSFVAADNPGEGHHLSTPNIHPSPFSNQRRSQRIFLSVRILVTGKRELGGAFSERTSTVIVNAHGAMIHLRESVRQGQLLDIRNLATEEDLACKVVEVNLGPNDTPEVAVEFAQPNARFWHVSFPPADWTPRSPEARRFSAAPAATPRPASIPNVNPLGKK
jgi:hypothetical protein